MSKHYKLKTHTRFFPAGEVVTADQLKAAGADDETVKDLAARNALEETTAAPTRADTPGIPSDEQNKLNVERAIAAKVAETGAPLSMAEQDKLAAETTADSGRPVRTDGKDVGKSEKLQEKARAAEAKAAGVPQQR